MRFGREPTNLTLEAENIVSAVYSDLRRFAAVVADLDVDPDDLVQDALVATLRRTSLETLDNPLAYLKRAVVNHSVSHRRRSARWKGLVPKLAVGNNYHDHYPSDLAALAELSATDRAALYLAEIDGYTHQEIGQMLKLSASAVSKRVSRARQKLRDEITASDGPQSHHTARIWV